MRNFHEFIGAKRRESKKQLMVMKSVLEQGGFKVKEFLADHFKDPYIYCYNPNKDTSFAGIRIYKIGNKIAYRIQRESETHPYGAAYMIDVDEIFNELMSSGTTKKEKLGHEIIKDIIENIKAFFKESAKSEKEDDDLEDEIGSVQVRSAMGGDYSSQVH